MCASVMASVIALLQRLGACCIFSILINTLYLKKNSFVFIFSTIIVGYGLLGPHDSSFACIDLVVYFIDQCMILMSRGK